MFLVRFLFCITCWRIAVGAKSGSSSGSSGLFSSWNDHPNSAKPSANTDDADYYVSEQDLSRASASRKKTGGSFGGSSFPSSSSTVDSDAEKRQKRMKAMQQREYDFDDRHDYSSEYRSSRRQDPHRPVGTGTRSSKQPGPSVTVDVDRGALSGLYGLTKHLPRVNLRIDPVINFKLKQKITTYFGACITLGMTFYDLHFNLSHPSTTQSCLGPLNLILTLTLTHPNPNPNPSNCRYGLFV